MKKFITSLLILIYLLFNIIVPTYAAATNIFKEGVYKTNDFNLTDNKNYAVQNTSSKDGIYVLIFDENQIGLQYVRLKPNSDKFNLVPLKNNYRIVILGDGEAFIS
ncbi:hypothetical protein [Clostridium saccharobutylicum]|uniref:Uncharacterized protein n=1 Tax=Clostridium saccharobutylicum DSM 13864 TaxID=1345695 RepID=U5MUD7_CLOSA|nr:hypothetical protein [Clostridium saccharobutylicum]AGX44215.1 hypothetical protein CLSA_c32490 [Clostridium saccharobutylicum DSM 13864]AQR91502.1 hypothetical protein CLOSC_32270 [Clostridium saccharobutylicum]AQS01407.1 hypothetical protein CSACC_32350 [Clostridium saccharobutylicum]AQS11016.1 hypothetical protein CLOBY_31650 [Clostridium saccharobutylicum]AQS15390.1 hypothetical protein CLOSACC_32350 [Clostridium saccharobutylicum]